MALQVVMWALAICLGIASLIFAVYGIGLMRVMWRAAKSVPLSKPGIGPGGQAVALCPICMKEVPVGLGEMHHGEHEDGTPFVYADLELDDLWLHKWSEHESKST